MHDQPPGGLRSRSFAGLLGAQFLAAFNDQAIHAAAMFFAINTQTLNERDAIALMPVLFYAPWALFSSIAGWAADRYPKPAMLRLWKVAEVIICAVALVGFALGSRGLAAGPWIVLACVFLMGMHATFFGPAKYGIMPELMPPHELSRGNGILESLSFLAVIFGTIAGGVLSFLFLRREEWIGVILLGLAVIGWLFSLWLRPLPPSNPQRPFPRFIYLPILQNVALMWRRIPLRVALVGIAFFTFVVAFMRASVYMLGESQNPRWDEMKTSAVVGTVALGIGFGSPLAGFLSGRIIRPRLILLGAAGMALGCLIGAMFIGELPVLLVSIIGIGFFTGFYLVPLFTLLQKSAPPKLKGEMVATSNFVDVSGAILSSLLFFGVVVIAQKTGVVPTVEFRTVLVEGTLTELHIHRGRPVGFAVRDHLGRDVHRGTVPVESGGLAELWANVRGENPSRERFDVNRRLETTLPGPQGPAVSVTTYEIDGVTYYDLMPAGEPPAADYDYRPLPRWLFAGAAAIILMGLIWLWRPVRSMDGANVAYPIDPPAGLR